jgi:glutamyl-tRNA reductase
VTLLNIGISHRTAPLDILERHVIGREQADKLVRDLVSTRYVSEAVVVATCNRVEIYADVERFHACVDEVTELLARHCRTDVESLTPYLGVRYADAVVAHAFTVAAGLDSMAIGETQILGQLRAALQHGQAGHSVGQVLNALLQQALRVGKRVHAESDIDTVGRSLVERGLATVVDQLGNLRGRRVLVVGAGSIAALTTAILRRDHDATVLVANRTFARARRVADSYGAEPVELAAVPALLANDDERIDLVISCTGSPGAVLTLPVVAPVAARRPVLVLDLAMPRDVLPDVAALPGVTVIDLSVLEHAADIPRAVLDPVRLIVADEVAAFHDHATRSAAAPAIAALRNMAGEVVDAELARLRTRTPDLSPADQAQVAQTVRRVVDKLLHAPTVRVKELSGQPAATSYAEALRELFALDPATVDALSTTDPDVDPGAVR